MSTRLGQRLATHVPFMSRLWKREMDAALERQAEFEHALTRDLLLKAINRWASSPEREHDRVMAAWCSWRNAAERLHRQREQRFGYRIPLPLALTGMPRMDDDEALLAFLRGSPASEQVGDAGADSDDADSQ